MVGGEDMQTLDGNAISKMMIFNFTEYAEVCRFGLGLPKWALSKMSSILEILSKGSNYYVKPKQKYASNVMCLLDKEDDRIRNAVPVIPT